MPTDTPFITGWLSNQFERCGPPDYCHGSPLPETTGGERAMPGLLDLIERPDNDQ
jgi:hypothetical protein